MHEGHDAPGPRWSGLTDRELQVLALVAQGEPVASIGHRLGISTATVKSHLNRIYRKIGARNRLDAARFYLRKARLR